MHYSCAIFSEIQTILLNSQNPERCVNQSCTEIFLLCLTLFAQDLTQEDYNILEVSIANLNYLWLQAHLNFTPKLHSTVEHSLDRMRCFNGIGDMLADDVEHIHQIAAYIKAAQAKCIQKWKQCRLEGRFKRHQKSQFS
jgi:hypothetical protein